MQIVRGTMALPHGAKKVFRTFARPWEQIIVTCSLFTTLHLSFQEVRVAIFAEGVDADEARAAGADIVGGAELIEEIASTKPLLLILIVYICLIRLLPCLN